MTEFGLLKGSAAAEAEVSSAKGERGVVTDGSLRLAPLAAWPRVLDSFGAATDGLLAAAGLGRDDFEDPETIVSFRAVDDLMVRSVRATGCDHLGLLIGRHATLSSLGAIGFLMQASPTVGDALRLLQRHLRVHDRGAVIGFDPGGPQALLDYRITVSGLTAVDQLYTVAALTGCNLLRALRGGVSILSEVRLPFAPPRRREQYAAIFGVPLRFDADDLALVFPVTELASPCVQADPLLFRMMSERVEQLEASMRRNLADEVRHLLRTLIFLEQDTPAVIARRMGVSLRTLHRRLGAAGTSVRALRDEVACDVACQLLALTSKPASEIASLLRYSDSSAFSRAFRRWRGMAPAAWRAAARLR